jgi:hypothetical protein
MGLNLRIHQGSSVTLVDAAKRHQSLDVDMTVPDDYPPGTYTHAGRITDLAGNETTVTLILVVEGPVPPGSSTQQMM